MENEKSKFEELLENYIINEDESHNNEYNCTFGNEGVEENIHLPNLSKNIQLSETFTFLINEKNQLIDDLKSFIRDQKDNFEKEVGKRDIEINNLKLKCNHLEEKNKIYESKNKSEIIDYYERQIKKTLVEYNNSFNIFKNNMDHIDSSFITNCSGTQKQINSLKSVINSLLKQNEQLNEELFSLKKIDRMNHIYKNLINKFAGELENNKKEYETISKNQTGYVKSLEEEIKKLKSELQEERSQPPPRKCQCEENEFLFKNISSQTQEKKTMFIPEDSGAMSYSREYTNQLDNTSLSGKDKSFANFHTFTKIITSSKIILKDKLGKLNELNDAILAKLETVNFKNNPHLHSIKINLKKLIKNSNDELDLVKTQIVYLNSQSLNNYKIGMLLQSIIKEIFDKFEVRKKL